MARDYAKHRTSNRSRKSNHSRKSGKSSRIIWLLFGIGLGALFSGFGYIKNHTSTALKDKISSIKQLSLAHPNEAKKSAAKPHFDYYTELPKMKVWVPDHKETANTAAKPPMPSIKDKEQSSIQNDKVADATLNETTTIAPTAQEKTASHTENKARYMLQVASLTNSDQADQLKAQLILLGYDVIINQQQGKNRVLVGPFASSQAATKAQADLAHEKLNSVILKSSS